MIKIPKKRRMEGRTNYSKRRRLLENNKARIVIRKTNKYIILQYVISKEAMDFVKINVNSKDLLNYGWPSDKSGSLKSLAAAYLAGLLFGNRLKKDKFEKEPAIDTGIITSTKGSRVYAALKGIIEAGIKLNHDEAMLPKENRIKNKSEDFFEKVKEKIMGGNKK